VLKTYRVGVGNTTIIVPIDQLKTGTHYLQVVPAGKMPLKAIPFMKY